jgi:hypothetical protein
LLSIVLFSHCLKLFFLSLSLSRRAVTFRRVIAEAKHDMDTLQKLWTEGKRDAIAEEVKKMDNLKEDEHEEVVEILDAHFDPEKKPVKPIVQRRESTSGGNGNGNNDRDRNMRNNQQQRRRRNPRGRSMNKENTRPRSSNNNQRRRSVTDNRYNNNNNNMDHPKGMRKDQQHQVDANQNTVMVSAN